MRRLRARRTTLLLLAAIVAAPGLSSALIGCRAGPRQGSASATEAITSPAETATESGVIASPTPTSTQAVAASSPTPCGTPTSPVAFEDTPTPIPYATGEAQLPLPVYTYKVINIYPHDPGAWTQGLVFSHGMIYESTGRFGSSSLRLIDLQSGEVLQMRSLPEHYYGEGLTLIDERLIQLTWKSQVGFVYARDTFELLRTFEYSGQGWGITHDGRRLIMSDGTATLHFLDPQSLQKTGQIQVRGTSGPVVRLNELEYVKGEVYANVWQTDWIVTADPDTGWVIGWIDLTGLLGPQHHSEPVDVLNGIAYDPEGDRLFVTGKLWPKVFEIELVPKQ